jgi:hypothetical protein
MKRNILAALICALAIPAAAFAAGTAERPASKKHVTVAQTTQTKKETVTQKGAADSTAKKSGKKARKSGKVRAPGNAAPKAGSTAKPDSSAK